MAQTDERHCDVLVIGAGPSGSSCAYWLAKAGHDVVVVERKAFPREKTCGDGLTPRSVRQLQDMGLATSCILPPLRGAAFPRLRAQTLVLPWPAVKGLPAYGYVVTRKDLDGMVAGQCGQGGATLWEHTEAAEPIMEGPSLRGARLVAKGDDGHGGQVTARYVVVADGANSRFGWAIGNQRKRAYPQGMALQGLLGFAAPRRALDRFVARPEGRGGQHDAGLRVDFPARGRADQRGRRPADHLGRLEGRQHHPDARGLLQVGAPFLGYHGPRPAWARPPEAACPWALPSARGRAVPTWS